MGIPKRTAVAAFGLVFVGAAALTTAASASAAPVQPPGPDGPDGQVVYVPSGTNGQTGVDGHQVKPGTTTPAGGTWVYVLPGRWVYVPSAAR